MYEEYEELVRLLKDRAEGFDYDGWVETAVVLEKAAEAIEELSRLAEINAKRAMKWAADAEKVRHGRWHDVYLSGASSFVGTCSVCGKSNDIPPVPLAKYCPSCGAKMDGGQDDGMDIGV